MNLERREAAIKIGFIGTGGTGKTTTAIELEKFIQEKYFPGVMRGVLEVRGLTELSINGMLGEAIFRLQKTGFDAKMNQDGKEPRGIFDRTLLDHFGYCLFRCSPFIDDSVCKSMMILVKENLTKYDLLFYFPMYEWTLQGDGFRDDSYANRLTHDIIIRGLIKEMHCEIYTVPDIRVEDRIRFILSFMERAEVPVSAAH